MTWIATAKQTQRLKEPLCLGPARSPPRLHIFTNPAKEKGGGKKKEMHKWMNHQQQDDSSCCSNRNEALFCLDEATTLAASSACRVRCAGGWRPRELVTEMMN